MFALRLGDGRRGILTTVDVSILSHFLPILAMIHDTMAQNERKRKKLVPPTSEDVMILARQMWRRDVHRE